MSPNKSYLRLLHFPCPLWVAPVYTGDRRGGLRNLPEAIKAFCFSLFTVIHTLKTHSITAHLDILLSCLQFTHTVLNLLCQIRYLSKRAYAA